MAASTKFSFTTYARVDSAALATLAITNKCNFIVFPVIVSAAVTSRLTTTGFPLEQGASITISVPPDWSGRLWTRTHCSYDSAGKFFCGTGDCGFSTVECGGGNAEPPVTMMELSLKGTGGMDVYKVSLVYGFNIPVWMKPQGGNGNCMATGCVSNLNVECPTELKVIRDGDTVACKAESYLSSHFFHTACPLANGSSFTCASDLYTITFCPTSCGTAAKSVLREPVKMVALVIALVSICGTLYIVCQMKIRFPYGDCMFHIGAGTTT
ncbi:Thaumatin-like protein 1, partial [Mucuna pruriens]